LLLFRQENNERCERSFEVRRVVNDSAGQDRITARARNLSTDEVCRGSATF
jgi:hypothetical protein